MKIICILLFNILAGVWGLDELIIPINLKDKHWVCAIIDLKGYTLGYFDSVGDRRAESWFKKAKKWLRDEKKLVDPEFDFDSIKWDKHTVCPTQDIKDAVHCGIFTIVAMRYLTEDKPFLEELTPDQIHNERIKLFNDLTDKKNHCGLSLKEDEVC